MKVNDTINIIESTFLIINNSFVIKKLVLDKSIKSNL